MENNETYKVIYKKELSKLVKEVNEHIKQGWKPLGGISTAITKTKVNSQNAIVFNCYQALIRE